MTSIITPSGEYVDLNILFESAERVWPGNGHTLVGKYMEPHRVYHDLSHIYFMVKSLDPIGTYWGFSHIIPRLEEAIWFHDFFYDAEGNNEMRSATFHEEHLPNANPEVTDAILKTIDHKNPKGLFQSVFLDLDLYGLGSNWNRYNQNTYNIFREYQKMSTLNGEDFSNAWEIGRTKFLRSMLERPKIYHSSYGQGLESLARKNIERELEDYRKD